MRDAQLASPLLGIADNDRDQHLRQAALPMDPEYQDAADSQDKQQAPKPARPF